MIFCSNCGARLSNDMNFCPKCGHAVAESGTNSNEREIVYEGDIHKCPNCGETIPSFETHCPSCGYEFRDTDASDAVRELANKLETIEKNRKPPNSINKNNKKTNTENNINEVDEQKINFIRIFPIPNNKEDMTEFLILASSNIIEVEDGKTKSQIALSDAWKAKFEQAYSKAKISFGNSADFKNISDIYIRTKSRIKKAKTKYALGLLCIFGIVFGFMIFEGISLVNLSRVEDSHNKSMIDEENARLNAIVEEVYKAIEDENYVLARAKASTLAFSVAEYTSENEENEEKWDKIKENMLEIIDEASGINTHDIEENTEYQQTTKKEDTNDVGPMDSIIDGFNKWYSSNIDNQGE